MLNADIADLRENLYLMLEQAAKYSEPITVSTKDGNVVIMSEDDYRSIMETLYLASIPGMKEKIIEGLNTPAESCEPEDKVSWHYDI